MSSIKVTTAIAAVCAVVVIAILVASRRIAERPATNPVPAALIAKRDGLAREYEAAVADLDALKPEPGLETPEKVRLYREARERIADAERKAADDIDESNIQLEMHQQILKLDLSDLEPREIEWRTQKIRRDADTRIFERKMSRLTAAAKASESEASQMRDKNAAQIKAAERVAKLRQELDAIEQQIASH